MNHLKTSLNKDLNKTESTHRSFLLKNLERRFKVAKEQGNEALIRQLEDERRQLAL
jgi:hypothetical protein